MKATIFKIFVFFDRIIYRKNDFVIVSNNCWGAEVYKRLGLEYNTPFVGLFIYGEDYVKLLKNIDYYLALELSFVNYSKWTDLQINYPIGMLDDIEVHFMHYKSSLEAKTKWERRIKRMNIIKDKNKWFFKICERDNIDIDLIKKFHHLPYKNKISFSVTLLNHQNHIVLESNNDEKMVPDGISLYKLTYKYFDLLKWVTNNQFVGNIYSKMKFYLKVL